MDCRTFHRKLEDYLEGGLDFPARFGMERHAKQCYACEKDVTAALTLRQMTHDLRRVSAPTDFETLLLTRIQEEKSHRHFWKLQSLWLYGLEGFSWRAASVTALVTVLIVGTVTYIHFENGRDRSTPMVSQAAMGSEANALLERTNRTRATTNGLPANARLGLSNALGSLEEITAHNPATPYTEPAGSDFVEFLVPVSGGRQLIMRLPRTIRLRYDQPSQEYFVRNVSH